MGTGTVAQEPIVLVIDFHHARGPEVQHCFCENGSDPVAENDWSLLPFMALSDGAHTSTEDFSYFTLKRNATTSAPATSLFGISCSRQMDASLLINRPPEVTRSTVQKAVVAIINEPRHFGQLREKLSIVTSAWFAQRDFSDIDILKKFWESLKASLNSEEAKKDVPLGLSLREMIHEFRHQTLVLFKCLLLQPKMLFFGSRCERLCMIQFSLISLIPGLIHHLEDCADPSFDSYALRAEKPTSLKTSERSSLLAYMGLPLQIFGKGSMFGPYTPLQQLDLLADDGTKSYIVGSTNSLLLQQKDRYSDILINLDEDNVTISSTTLRTALALTTADRRWIDFLTQTINETWDEAHPERPKTYAYVGSEEFIRLQFEEYLLALLSCVKYQNELSGSTSPHTTNKSPGLNSQAMNIEGDPALEFNQDFLNLWRTTPNYALFDRLTSDALLFSIVEPRHPCSGGLGIDDIQRRLAQQVADLHLDERVREGREALNKHLATGQKKVSSVFNSFWSDLEAMRDAQRRKNEEKNGSTSDRRTSLEKDSRTSIASPRPSMSSIRSAGSTSWSLSGKKAPQVDLSQVQATAAAASQRATAYFSSWGSWASERRKEWQERRSSANSAQNSPATTPRPSLSANRSETGEATVPLAVMHTRSEASSSLSRSGSRRKRLSNIILRRGSRDSIASTNTNNSDEPRKQERALESKHPSQPPTPSSQARPPPQSTPPVPVIVPVPTSDPLPATGQQESAPSPTLMPSDRLQTTVTVDPAISPFQLDESENVFTDVDLSTTAGKQREQGEVDNSAGNSEAGATRAAEKS